MIHTSTYRPAYQIARVNGPGNLPQWLPRVVWAFDTFTTLDAVGSEYAAMEAIANEVAKYGHGIGECRRM